VAHGVSYDATSGGVPWRVIGSRMRQRATAEAPEESWAAPPVTHGYATARHVVLLAWRVVSYELADRGASMDTRYATADDAFCRRDVSMRHTASTLSHSAPLVTPSASRCTPLRRAHTPCVASLNATMSHAIRHPLVANTPPPASFAPHSRPYPCPRAQPRGHGPAPHVRRTRSRNRSACASRPSGRAAWRARGRRSCVRPRALPSTMSAPSPHSRPPLDLVSRTTSALSSARCRTAAGRGRARSIRLTCAVARGLTWRTFAPAAAFRRHRP
jgi:hypothetical protein